MYFLFKWGTKYFVRYGWDINLKLTCPGSDYFRKFLLYIYVGRKECRKLSSTSKYSEKLREKTKRDTKRREDQSEFLYAQVLEKSIIIIIINVTSRKGVWNVTENSLLRQTSSKNKDGQIVFKTLHKFSHLFGIAMHYIDLKTYRNIVTTKMCSKHCTRKSLLPFFCQQFKHLQIKRRRRQVSCVCVCVQTDEKINM